MEKKRNKKHIANGVKEDTVNELEDDADTGQQQECLMFVGRGEGDGEFRPLLSAERRRNSPRPNHSESVLPERLEAAYPTELAADSSAADSRAAGVNSVRLEAHPIQTNRRRFSFHELQAEFGASTLPSASQYLATGLSCEPADCLDAGDGWAARGSSPSRQRQRGSFEQIYALPSDAEAAAVATSRAAAVSIGADAGGALECAPLKKFSWSAVGGGGGKLNLETVSTAAPSPMGYSPRDSPMNSPRISDKEQHIILFQSVEAISTRGSRENADGEALRSGPRSRRDSLSEVVQRRDHVARKARTSSQTRWR